MCRTWQTAVCTGSQMIVCSGVHSGGFLNGGSRYCAVGPSATPTPTPPSSADTWTATNTTNPPAARAQHTAVWTGSKMIVWGGYGECVGGYCSSGGQYDPSTDSWTATSITNAPDGRYSHTAVWTGSEMI